MGCLVVVILCIVAAFLVEYWQIALPLVGVLLVLCIVLSVRENKKKRAAVARAAQAAAEERKRQEREAAEAARRRAAEEARQKLQREKDEITKELRSLLWNSDPSCVDAMYYIQSFKSNLGDHARAEGRKYENHIHNSTLQYIRKADFAKALQALKLLTYLFPNNTRYLQQENDLIPLHDTCRMPSCFIMDKTYGKPKSEIVQRISVMTHEQCRKSMEANGLLYSLWFFAVKEPFDSVSYRNVLQAVKSLRPEYFHVSTDAMLSAAYVARRQDRGKLQEFYPDWQRDLMTYLLKASPDALLMMASTSSWSRDILTEVKCLESLKQMNKLPDNLTSQYEYLKKMQSHMKKMGF